MTRAARAFWVALAFWHPGPAQAQEPDIGQLYAEVAATDTRVNTDGAYEHPLDGTPFANGWLPTRQVCILLVDPDHLGIILDIEPAVPLYIRERTAIAHEFAHCLVRAGMPDAPKAHDTHSDELFADLFALAWTAKYHPEDEEAAHAFLWTLRNKYHDRDRSHPRASELRRFEKSLDSPQVQAYRAMHS